MPDEGHIEAIERLHEKLLEARTNVKSAEVLNEHGYEVDDLLEEARKDAASLCQQIYTHYAQLQQDFLNGKLDV